MPFHLRVGQPVLAQRPELVMARAPASTAAAFVRGLLIGFFGAFVVFDWALLGSATTRAVIAGVQHGLLGR